MLYKLQFVDVLYERNVRIQKQYAVHIYCVYKLQKMLTGR